MSLARVITVAGGAAGLIGGAAAIGGSRALFDHGNAVATPPESRGDVRSDEVGALAEHVGAHAGALALGAGALGGGAAALFVAAAVGSGGGQLSPLGRFAIGAATTTFLGAMLGVMALTVADTMRAR